MADSGSTAAAPAAGGMPAFEIERLEWVKPDVDLLEQNRIVIDERSIASAAYKVLRTRVLQRMRRNGFVQGRALLAKPVALRRVCTDFGRVGVGTGWRAAPGRRASPRDSPRS